MKNNMQIPVLQPTIQSMTNTPTQDVEATAAQCKRIIDAGADLVRIAVPSMREVESFAQIKKYLRTAGYTTPLVADVHFSAAVATAVAAIADKVRINPGNFSDKRTKNYANFTSADYKESLLQMATKAQPFFETCKQHNTKVRIGVNHGSLSDRIIHSYGNTAKAMAISAMEWIDLCMKFEFQNIVLSLKSSQAIIMMEATLLLRQFMEERAVDYPLHLGVTEAGNGLEGRAKSAAGIGALLLHGIGNTIRVSLTEAPENEIVFAKILMEELQQIPTCKYTFSQHTLYYNEPQIDKDRLIAQAAALCAYWHYKEKVKELIIDNPHFSDAENQELANIILQACRIKMSKTEFISCPSCGRTQYNIIETLEKVKNAFSEYPNLKIGVMGCIVNGPGEMADADFGVVGTSRGLVTLFKGKEQASEQLFVDEALKRLHAMIEEELSNNKTSF